MDSDAIDFTNRSDLENTVSDSGAITLSWDAPAAAEVELQQSPDSTFASAVVRYSGRDSGSVLTGLAEGTHCFRVRLAGSTEWSPPLVVRVAFLPRGRLSLLLGIGGFVVVATVGAIVAGHLMTGRKEGG